MRVRYLIKFTKGENIKFISHLDLLRTVQRVGKRSELPVEYSKGFNPHMAMVIAMPLSVGIYSDGDYIDLYLTEDIDCELVKNKLNENSATGIKFISVSKSPIFENVKRLPQAMALLDAASYEIKIKYNDIINLEEDIKAFIEKEEYITLKKAKKTEKLADIKPLILEFNYEIKENILELNILIRCGSRETLSPALLANYLKENTRGVNEDAFTEIRRIEMYGYKNEELVPLCEYID